MTVPSLCFTSQARPTRARAAPVPGSTSRTAIWWCRRWTLRVARPSYSESHRCMMPSDESPRPRWACWPPRPNPLVFLPAVCFLGPFCWPSFANDVVIFCDVCRMAVMTATRLRASNPQPLQKTILMQAMMNLAAAVAATRRLQPQRPRQGRSHIEQAQGQACRLPPPPPPAGPWVLMPPALVPDPSRQHLGPLCLISQRRATAAPLRQGAHAGRQQRRRRRRRRPRAIRPQRP